MFVKIKNYVFDTNIISSYKNADAIIDYNTPDECYTFDSHGRQRKVENYRYGILIRLHNCADGYSINIPFDSIEERDSYFQALTELISAKELI